MVGPIAGGLVGCVLLLLFYLDASHVGFITVVMLGIIAVWIVTGRKVYGEYRNTLSEALVQRILEGGSSIYDDSMIDILKEHLTSRHPGEVIYALDLLDHPSPEVRKEVLDRIRQELRSEMIDAVRRSVTEELDDDVKSHALRSLCALGESDVLDEVFPHIEHPSPQVRRGVISGMLRYGGIDGVLTAAQHLIELEHSEDPEDRIFTARVLGDVGISSFYRPLIRLLKDDDPEVRVASLLASGEVKSPRLWPLGLPRYHPYAAKALVRAGEQALIPIREVLESEEFGRDVKVRAATVCGRIPGQNTQALLIEFLTVLDGDRTFVQLGEREFFGELTTLDPAPHSATVTSTQPTTLLGLDREGLYELMSDHPEVLREIIHELCERLRRKS
jgi:AAA family ATP:ADP antiporter